MSIRVVGSVTAFIAPERSRSMYHGSRKEAVRLVTPQIGLDERVGHQCGVVGRDTEALEYLASEVTQRCRSDAVALGGGLNHVRTSRRT